MTKRIPIIMLLHPVGIGSTRDMNVHSAKLWIRVLVDLLPDVVISAPWLPYAEAMIDRDRGIRDALATVYRHDGAVAVGGEFSWGMSLEWEEYGRLRLPRIDLTRPPLPGILNQGSQDKVLHPDFKQAVVQAFRNALVKEAA
jgi:hypothetical protein